MQTNCHAVVRRSKAHVGPILGPRKRMDPGGAWPQAHVFLDLCHPVLQSDYKLKYNLNSFLLFTQVTYWKTDRSGTVAQQSSVHGCSMWLPWVIRHTSHLNEI
jgi:hypothetical protein